MIDYIFRRMFGHKCFACGKIIEKGNYAGEFENKDVCIDCIIKPEIGWTKDILTREDYFEYMGKQYTREEWNKTRESLGYSPMFRIKWFFCHYFD